MKKIIAGIMVLCAFHHSHAGFIANTISLKSDIAPSYTDEITVGWNNDSFSVKMSIIPDTNEPNTLFRVSLLGLPTGLSFDNFEIESDTCTTQIQDIVSEDNAFNFSYTPNGTTPCNAIINANYNTQNVPNGSYTLSYSLQNLADLSTRTSSNNVTLRSEAGIRILQANTQDNDADWFLDAFEITFNQDIGSNVLNTSNVEIATNEASATNLAFTKINETSARITFDDNIFHSWELPTIEITNSHNNYDQEVYRSEIQDTATPVIRTFNSTNFSSQSISLETIPASFVIAFSEQIRESEISNITASVNGNFSLNTDKDTLTFTPDTTFSDNQNYAIQFNNALQDIAGNSLQSPTSLSITIGRTSSGWGGGGGWGWWGSSLGSYDSEDRVSRVIKATDNLRSGVNRITGRLEVTGNIITTEGQSVELKGHSRALSLITIPENTRITSETPDWDRIFSPVVLIDHNKKIRDGIINLAGQNIDTKLLGGVYMIGIGDEKIRTNQPVAIRLDIDKNTSRFPFYVLRSNNLDGEFKTFWPDSLFSQDGIIEFEIDEFGYYIVIQERFLPLDNNITFINVQEQLEEQLQNDLVKTLSRQYYEKLDFEDKEYILSFDTQLADEFSEYARAHYEIFSNLEKFINTRENSLKAKILNDLQVVEQAWWQDIQGKYIQDIVLANQSIKTPTNPQLAQILEGALSKKFIRKLNTLKARNIIDQTEFDMALTAYNNFVFHFVALQEYNYTPAREKAIKEAKIFLETYNK